MTRGSLVLACLVGLLFRPAASQDVQRLYERGCAEADMVACNILGLLYEAGEGIPQNLARAAELYERACEGGELGGCTNLALMYQAGAGVAQDALRAASLYQRACDGGEMLGCDRLEALNQVNQGAAPPAGFLTAGRTADDESGEFLAEAIVELPDLGIRVVSDASGRVDLGTVTVGTHRVRAERVGYEMVDGELEVPGSAEFLILMSRARLSDMLAPGRIRGRVMGGGASGLSDVEITVLSSSSRQSRLSNPQGRFLFREVEPGLAELRFTRLGFAPRTAAVVVQPGGIVEITATMSTQAIELEPIEVTVGSRSLDQSGFYNRVERVQGRHFTRQDIEVINPVELTDMFVGLPGVSVLPGGQIESRRARTLSQISCVLTVYVDGVRSSETSLRQISLQEVEAIEAYDMASTPVQYRAAGAAFCGVILIWTRR